MPDEIYLSLLPLVFNRKSNLTCQSLFFLLLGYAETNDVFPVYIGDDRTDEDAFKVNYRTLVIFSILLMLDEKL